MQSKGRYIKDFFVTDRFYLSTAVCILAFLVAHFLPELLLPTRILFYSFLLLFFIDILLLFFLRNGLNAHRIVNDKLSNGEENLVNISILNPYPFDVIVTVIDELPEQIQERSFSLKTRIGAKEKKNIAYTLRPSERYSFAN